MRQIGTIVRLRGNRGVGMASGPVGESPLGVLQIALAGQARPVPSAIAFPRVRYGFGPRAVAPRGRSGESDEIRLKGR